MAESSECIDNRSRSAADGALIAFTDLEKVCRGSRVTLMFTSSHEFE
jgi:hypothetical protein